MNKQNENQFHRDDRLRESLSKAFKAPGSVPPKIDQKVFQAAQLHFAKHRRRNAVWKWTGRAVVAAAAIFIVTGLCIRFYFAPDLSSRSDFSMSKSVAEIGTADKVTILDALMLANKIQNGHISSDMDKNGDGTVDHRDVDTVAMAAVRLTPER